MDAELHVGAPCLWNLLTLCIIQERCASQAQTLQGAFESKRNQLSALQSYGEARIHEMKIRMILFPGKHRHNI